MRQKIIFFLEIVFWTRTKHKMYLCKILGQHVLNFDKKNHNDRMGTLPHQQSWRSVFSLESLSRSTQAVSASRTIQPTKHAPKPTHSHVKFTDQATKDASKIATTRIPSRLQLEVFGGSKLAIPVFRLESELDLLRTGRVRLGMHLHRGQRADLAALITGLTVV